MENAVATITPAGGQSLDLDCLLDAVGSAGFEWLDATLEAEGELSGTRLVTPRLVAPLTLAADGDAGVDAERLAALGGRRVHVEARREPRGGGPAWKVLRLVEAGQRR